MPQLLLLRGAKQLLTLRGQEGVRRGAALNDLGLIEDGSVLIQDGRIVSVGPTRRIENLKEARGAVEVSARGQIIMPGFVDPGVYVTLYDRKDPAKRKKALDFYHESLTLMRSCLQHGTLNAQAKVYSEGDSAAGDLAALRQLLNIGSTPVGMARSLRLHPAAIEESKLDNLPARLAHLKRNNLAEFVEVVCNQLDQPCDERLWKLVAKAGLKLNLLWSAGPPDRLWQMIKQAHPRAVFCPAEMSSPECSALTNSNSIAVFTPCKELLEERDNPSVKKLAAAGAAIALASGYDSKDAPIFSMQMVVALAVLRLRLTVEQAIVATTINAAHALGWDAEIGSLEVGKRADLLLLNLSDYREIPRRFGVNHVSMAIREGNIVINRVRAKASAV